MIRTTKALLNLKEEVICWPDGKEKESLKLRIKISSGFQKCIGIIDGTLIFLHERPKKYGDSYYCRKGRYAVNVQVICDDNRKITYYYGGWPDQPMITEHGRTVRYFAIDRTTFQMVNIY